jgi:hypothetical protein
MLSIADQVAGMRHRQPQFRVLLRTAWCVCWEGPLCPLSQTYTVRVFYCIGRDLEHVEILPFPPIVTVLEPLLERRPEEPDEPIPHHYPNCRRPELPILCLDDPRAEEWDHASSIADTTIPWAIDWLACYEGWRATGEWTGGGRHMTTENRPRCPTPPSHQDDRSARSDSAAFHSLGRRIGIFASWPLMAVASVGSFRPLTWRDWRNATWVARLWRTISTLSQAPRPAGFSPVASESGFRPPNSPIFTSNAEARSSRPSGAASLGVRSAA